jgi:hypothetical protein
MKNLKLAVSFFSAISLLTVVSCKKDDPALAPLTAITVSDLKADPATSYDSLGNPSGFLNKFTFFSFSTGAVVANSDSATTKWDIGFNRTTIIVNAGTSGPGAGGALVEIASFSDVTVAPDTGFKTDNEPSRAAYFNSETPDTNFAIPTGSDAAWYHYDDAAHIITPIAGRVLVIKTATGKYAKVEILSFYKGAPANPNAYTDQDSYFTFRYDYQANGSKTLQ